MRSIVPWTGRSPECRRAYNSTRGIARIAALAAGLCSCVLAFSHLQAVLSQQCPPGYENPAVTRYRKVMDILFPREPCSLPGGQFVLILRFMPAFDRESQIVIRKLQHQAYAVTHYRLPRDSRSVFEQIHDLLSEADQPEEIAKRIRVKVGEVSLPKSTMAELMTRYSKLRLSPELDTEVILDASWYQLWFHTTSSSSDVHFSLGGPDYGHDAKAHPLVRWMNEVKRVVEKYAPKD